MKCAHILFLLGFLSLSSAAQAQYSVDIPLLVACPSGMSGEATVVETTAYTKWRLLKWTCTTHSGLADKYTLEQYYQNNPPKPTDDRRYEERCPSGSVGVVRWIVPHGGLRRIESWSCAVGNTKMTLPQLEAALVAPASFSGAQGIERTQNCPPPYEGSVRWRYQDQKWNLSQWTCKATGANQPLSEAQMRLILGK